MARLTNHFENDGDTGSYTPIKYHDTSPNEAIDENAPPQPPAHLIDPASKGRQSAAATQAVTNPSESTTQQGLSRDMLLLLRAVAVAGIIDTHSDSAVLASPAAGPAPPHSVAYEAAGGDDAFSQIGSPRLSASRHSANLSESLSTSSPRWSYENLRNQRWSYNSDVMEKGVHDLKTLGEREGDGHGGHNAESLVDGAATKDELNLTVRVN